MATNLSSQFEYELKVIRDIDIRELLKYILDSKVPEYFLTNQSSSSGRYHPINKDGGPETLIQHTKSVFRMLYYILSHPLLKDTFDAHTVDVLLASSILHDSVKYGYPESETHTVHEHPILLKMLIDDTITSNKVWFNIFSEIVEFVGSHHGPWRTNPHSEVNLPPIENSGQWYLHLADYLASRTCIRVDYDFEELG